MTQAEQQERLNADLEAAIPGTLSGQKELAKRLWEAGIDADIKQDFPLSIKCYEKLKQLDPSIRQVDKTIDLRLDYARAQLPR
jgi:hypothetical protein